MGSLNTLTWRLSMGRPADLQWDILALKSLQFAEPVSQSRMFNSPTLKDISVRLYKP